MCTNNLTKTEQKTKRKWNSANSLCWLLYLYFHSASFYLFRFWRRNIHIVDGSWCHHCSVTTTCLSHRCHRIKGSPYRGYLVEVAVAFYSDDFLNNQKKNDSTYTQWINGRIYFTSHTLICMRAISIFFALLLLSFYDELAHMERAVRSSSSMSMLSLTIWTLEFTERLVFGFHLFIALFHESVSFMHSHSFGSIFHTLFSYFVGERKNGESDAPLLSEQITHLLNLLNCKIVSVGIPWRTFSLSHSLSFSRIHRLKCSFFY